MKDPLDSSWREFVASSRSTSLRCAHRAVQEIEWGRDCMGMALAVLQTYGLEEARETLRQLLHKTEHRIDEY